MKMLKPLLKTMDARTVQPIPKVVEPFYLSKEWRDLIDSIKRERGDKCERCPRHHVRLFGDHIVELRDGGAPLDRTNVMLLCGSCHTAKTAKARAERMRR